MSNFWVAAIMTGLGTYMIRAGFLLLKPPSSQAFLDFVSFIPAAALGALVFSESNILSETHQFDFPRLIGLFIGGYLAYQTRSIFWTFLGGGLGLWISQFVINYF